MSAEASAFLEFLRWMADHSRFPAQRLEGVAERLLLLSVVAALAESASAQPVRGGPIERRDAAKDSALRAHAMRRSMVHYRCDNSAKV